MYDDEDSEPEDDEPSEAHSDDYDTDEAPALECIYEDQSDVESDYSQESGDEEEEEEDEISSEDAEDAEAFFGLAGTDSSAIYIGGVCLHAAPSRHSPEYEAADEEAQDDDTSSNALVELTEEEEEEVERSLCKYETFLHVPNRVWDEFRLMQALDEARNLKNRNIHGCLAQDDDSYDHFEGYFGDDDQYEQDQPARLAREDECVYEDFEEATVIFEIERDEGLFTIIVTPPECCCD